MNYKIIALFGESGAGKDFYQRYITSLYPKETKSIVNCTTRPQRDNETNGKDYHFLKEHEFFSKVGHSEMLEWTMFRDWAYGTSIDELDDKKINIGVFNLKSIKRLLSFKSLDVIPVYISAEPKERLIHSLKRERNPDCLEICRRFEADSNDFKNIDFLYYFIYNDYKDIKDIAFIESLIKKFDMNYEGLN